MKVIQEKCISCGACISAAGDVFFWNDDGKSEVAKLPETPEALAAFKTSFEQGKNVCPMGAIEE
jgi:ferredoxin